MPFLCVYSGDEKNLAKIKARFTSAEIKNDGQFDCIALSDEDMEKYEQMMVTIKDLK